MKKYFSFEEMFKAILSCDEKEILIDYCNSIIKTDEIFEISDEFRIVIDKLLSIENNITIELARSLAAKYEDIYIRDLLIKHSYDKQIRNIVRDKYNIKEIVTEDNLINLYTFYEECDDVDILRHMKEKKIKSNRAIIKYIKNNKVSSLDVFDDLIENNNRYKVIYEISSTYLAHNKQIKMTDYFLDQAREEILKIARDDDLQQDKYKLIFPINGITLLRELFEVLSNRLIPAFNYVISEINKLYLSEESFYGVILDIARYVGIETFLEIAEIDKKHVRIFNKIYNTDISIFFTLMEQFKEDEFMNCLPAFCYYCSDHFNQIDQLKNLLIKIFDQHYHLTVQSINKLITSHYKNINENCILGNQISKEMSRRILQTFCDYNFISYYLQMFITHNKGDYEDGLDILLKEIDNEIFINTIHTNLKNNIEYAANARLIKYFNHKVAFDDSFINFIIDQILDERNEKANYTILECLSKDKQNSNLIKTFVFDHRIKNRNFVERIRLLVNLYRNNDDSIYNKTFYREIVLNFNIGKAKIKRYLKECLEENLFKEDFNVFLMENVLNNDEQVVKGCLEAILIIFNNFTVENDKNINNLFLDEVISSLHQNLFLHKTFEKTILDIYKVMLQNNTFTNYYRGIYDSMIKIIEIDYRKNNNLMTEIVQMLEEKGFERTKQLTRVKKFKNKSISSKKRIQVKRK